MKKNPCADCAASPTGLCDAHGARDGSRTATIVVRCAPRLKRVVQARARRLGMSEGRTAEDLMRTGLKEKQ